MSVLAHHTYSMGVVVGHCHDQADIHTSCLYYRRKELGHMPLAEHASSHMIDTRYLLSIPRKPDRKLLWPIGQLALNS